MSFCHTTRKWRRKPPRSVAFSRRGTRKADTDWCLAGRPVGGMIAQFVVDQRQKLTLACRSPDTTALRSCVISFVQIGYTFHDQRRGRRPPTHFGVTVWSCVRGLGPRRSLVDDRLHRRDNGGGVAAGVSRPRVQAVPLAGQTGENEDDSTRAYRDVMPGSLHPSERPTGGMSSGHLSFGCMLSSAITSTMLGQETKPSCLRHVAGTIP